VFKDTSLADLWMQRITEEYFLQGDDMVKRGMVVPEMMNRHSATPRQEITRSFIKFIAVPFFERCVWCACVVMTLSVCVRDRQMCRTLAASTGGYHASKQCAFAQCVCVVCALVDVGVVGQE
jgi:hypothetical protein